VIPKRTFWLTAGIALGAGSTLWAERRVRRTIEQTAARLAPDALVAEVGRTARHVAESAGDRVRDAYSEGRDEMYRREEELWSNLAERGVALAADGTIVAGGASATEPSKPGKSGKRSKPGEPASPMRTSRATGSAKDAKVTSSQTTPKRAASAARRRMTTRRAKSPSHLGN
jgi:hypothetical protein